MERKVALVVGASSDIGASICEYLCKSNIDVVLTYNKHELEAKNVYNSLKNKLNNSLLFKCDITNEDEVKELMKEIKNKYKTLDYVINNAAFERDNDIYEKSSKEFLDVLKTNVLGPFLVIKYASIIMTSGIIINISSTDGIDTYNIYNIDYSASKSALNNMTKNISNRFNNIKIVALAPNYIDNISTRSMNKDFLLSELRRLNQKELINIDTVSKSIINIINDKNLKTGSIIRLDDNNEYR